MIPLAQPVLDEEMQRAALDALQNDRFVLGENVSKFEEEFARYCGTELAVATASGTAALTLTLIALGVQSGSVVTTPMSFVATANSITHAGGTVRLADVNTQSYCLDPIKTETAIDHKTRAILPVHLYGQPAAMDELNEIANRKSVTILEDACQAHGAVYRGKRAGSLGTAACFSFYPSKNMTVGGDGGMVTTNDVAIAERVRSLRDSGRVKGEKYLHGMIGFTERLNSVQAAIGRVQLRRLNEWNERRIEVARTYEKNLHDTGDSILPPTRTEQITPVYHLYVIRSAKRNQLREWLSVRGVETGIHYPLPIHLQPSFDQTLHCQRGTYPISEQLCEEVLSIPIYPTLTSQDQTTVIDAIQKFYSTEGMNIGK